MNVCPECGKRHVVHWPEFWPYRRDKTFYCSQDCEIVSVTRDLTLIKDVARARRKQKLKKDYTDIAREFIRIKESGGGNREIFEYLESIGYENPEGAFYYIRKSLKKSDPELEAKIGNGKPGPAKKEAQKAPEAELTRPAVELVFDESIAEEYRKEQAEKAEKILAEGVSIRSNYFLECEVTAIRIKELGEFYYDVEHNCVDWRNPFGDEISLPLQGWKNLSEDLPAILKTLGVA